MSAWQQSVAMGSTTSWEEHIAAVRDSGGDVSTGSGFWLRQDLVRVIDTWATGVPLDRICLVTVPPRGAAPEVLLERFAAAIDLPPDIWGDAGTTERYLSFGAAELEVIRRLNARVVGPLTLRQHRLVIENGVRQRLRSTASRPLVLPPEHFSWARDRGRHGVAELRRRGTPVHGDLADLVPVEAPPTDRRLDDVSEAELLAAAEAILGSLAEAYATLSGRHRLARSQDGSPGATAALASLSRRTVFRVKKLAHRHADDNRLFAAAARRYVRPGR